MLKWFRSTGGHTTAIWWIIIVSSIIVFILGFSVAPSLVGSGPVAETVQVGSVEGQPITYGDYQQTIAQTLEAYRQQTGQDPGAREAPLLEEQAWMQIVTERAMTAEAKRLGYGTNDKELVFTIQSSPPPWIRTHPAFQTNGQFDAIKYQQALADPGNNWSGLEDEVRRILPAQKLQEMLLASSRFSEPELRRAYAEQNERVRVALALWSPPPGIPDTASLTGAEIRAYYEEHPELFSGPAQVRAEVVMVPKNLSAEDEQQALATAQSLADQVRAGSDFSQLARDMSEGPAAQMGGYMGVVALSQMPPAVIESVRAVGDSGLTVPVRDGSNYFLFQVKLDPGMAEPGYHMWQIAIPIRPSPESLQADRERLEKLRREAEREGLGPVAAEMGYIAQETGWFSATSFDPMLMSLPQAQQFAVGAPVGAVSVGYDLDANWAIVQVKDRREAGLHPFESVEAEVKVALAKERSLEPAMRAAESARQAIAAGADFLSAVAAAGANQSKRTEFFTRTTPDGLLGGTPRAVGLAFGLRDGEVGGPLRSTFGVYLIQREAGEPVTDEAFEAGKGAVSQQLLTASQQNHFGAWLEWYREGADVRDKRAEVLVAR